MPTKKTPKKTTNKPTKATKKPTKATTTPRKAAGHGPPAEPLRVARPVESFQLCRSLIRDVPDFPKPGIVYKDITPLLASPRALHIVLDAIAERFIGEHIDAIVGI